MQLDTVVYENLLVVTPRGRLDVLYAQELHSEIAALMAAGYHRLVLNCEHVSFMDCAVVHILIRACLSARRSGGDLRLARCKGQPALLLQLVPCLCFVCYESVSDARTHWCANNGVTTQQLSQNLVEALFRPVLNIA